MEDEFLEMQYEDRFYIPDYDDYEEYDPGLEECLDCDSIIDDEGLCLCE